LASAAIPMRIKALFAGAMAVVVFPIVAPSVPVGLGLVGLVPGLVGELAIGFLIGLCVGLMLSATQIAGLLVGQQAGIALGQIFNPDLETQTTILGQFQSLLATLVFLGVGGHRMVVRALLDSFAAVPVLSFRLGPQSTALLTDTLAASFVVAVRIAGPVLLALLMAHLAKGFVARTVPQLNILSVGFAIQVVVALAFLTAALGDGLDVFVEAVADVLVDLGAFLQG